MALDLKFTFPLPNGLHARPASIFRDAASQFQSDVTLQNYRDHSRANAKSALALVATLTRKDDACSLLIEGADEKDAFEALKRFLESEFPHCDDELVQDAIGERPGVLPHALRNVGVTVFEGTPVSRGIGRARAFIPKAVVHLPDFPRTANGTPAEELAKTEEAFGRVAANIRKQLEASQNKTQQQILGAHLSIAEDVEFASRVRDMLLSDGVSAGAAISAVAEQFTEILQHSASKFLRERILDIRDITRQVIEELYGSHSTNEDDLLTWDGIWVGENLSPADFISLDKGHLKGIALSQGGATSHTVILARAFGIPCIIGVKDIHKLLRSGQDLVIDGERGLVIPDPPPGVVGFYLGESKKLAKYRKRLATFKDVPGRTADKKPLEVDANVGSLEEVRVAFENGAEGIGLFRTELFFMNRPNPPTEDEQFAVYSGTARIAQKRGVIIRTLDVGGDKSIPYLNLPHEENPFLGYRAIRMYESHKDIIRSQLRAILRASVFGNLKIMLPMVSTVDEVRQFRAWLADEMKQLDREKVSYNRSIPVGITVEVPSTAFIIDQLSAVVDFFSLGTNDLTQYFLAVDRDNDDVGHLYSSFHPSFLRLVKKIVDDAHAAKKWVGVCGELGANKLALPLFVGLGVDEISLASADIAEVKATLSECRSKDSRRLLESALQAETPAQIEASLRLFQIRKSDKALIDEDVIRLESQSTTKEEALRELVDLLQLSGRIEEPDKVEETIWQREDTYSTGVGFQVAIPHCKSPLILANSVAILRLVSEIEWQSLDDRPVTLVILIVVKDDQASDVHLRMIAQLSRKLMDEKFRNQVLNAADKPALLELIRGALRLRNK
jgi:phosphoenolpyruvate-protein phosphotransferase